MQSPLNVVYVVSHDTGRFLGAYHPEIKFSPNLDRFAVESVRFNQAYCSAPCCGPSRVCAMTGKYSNHTGVLGLANWGWKLAWEERTIVDDFNDAGYDTVHCGFQHERLYGQGRYKFDGVPGGDESWFKSDSRMAVDRAISWLQQRDLSKPFYLNLATDQTHGGFFSGELANSRHGGPVPPDQAWIAPAWPDTPYIREQFSNWYASLRYLDGHFGRLMTALDELGLRDNTLVVYTTDHGIGGMRGKGSVYDLGVEIALYMRLPGGKLAGTTQDCLIPNIDYRPTFLEAAGLPAPAGIDGRSFWPLLSGGTYKPHERIFIERNFHGDWISRNSQEYADFYDPLRGVRTPEWHYIRNVIPGKRHRRPPAPEIRDYEPTFDHGLYDELPECTDPRPTEELYHVSEDPWEFRDVATDPRNARIKADLASALDKWMVETNDPALRPGVPQPVPYEDPIVWPMEGYPPIAVRRY